MKLGKMNSSIVICALMITTVMIPAMALADEKAITVDYPVDNGIKASFGFTIGYNPGTINVSKGDSVALSISPAPRTVDIRIDVEELMTTHGYSQPATFNANLPNEIILPIERAPLGSEAMKAYVVSVGPGKALIIDVETIGVMQASISTDGGELSSSVLTWNDWGAKETTLNTQTKDKITVNTSFSYNVSIGFDIGFLIAGVRMDEIRIPTVSLGLMEFPGEIAMTINTVRSYEEGYTNGTDEGYVLGYNDGYDEASEGLPKQDDPQAPSDNGNGTSSLGLMAIVITILVVVQVYRKKKRPD